MRNRERPCQVFLLVAHPLVDFGSCLAAESHTDKNAVIERDFHFRDFFSLCDIIIVILSKIIIQKNHIIHHRHLRMNLA